MIIEAPLTTVREHAPAEFARGQVFDTPEIAEHLRRGSSFLPSSARPAIKRPAPPFRFDDGEAELVASPLLRKSVGSGLGCALSKQQPVGHVLPAARCEILLTQTFGPSESAEDRPGQGRLGLTFVRDQRSRKPVEDAPEIQTKRFKGATVNVRPVG